MTDLLIPDDDDTSLGLLDDPLADDVVVEAVPPPPLGKSYAADFALGPDGQLFSPAVGDPRPTYGLDTLRVWIDKCLHTEAGASPIHPPGYGMIDHAGGIGEPFGSPALADREDHIRAALTFHPRIVDVVDYTADFDPDDDGFYESITVVLDDDTTLTLERSP